MTNSIAGKILRRSINQSVPDVSGMENPNSVMLKKLGLSWLPGDAVGFSVNSSQVQILTEPQAFYKTLLEKTMQANQRIILTALYLGTNPLETQFVSKIKERLCESPGLKVKVLLDCVRGSRGVDNSRKLLLPLVHDHDTCQVSLYHTPALRGSLVKLLPHRYKELIGVQHIKVYLFDNDLIISGANLSQDYFTQRQDRYLVVNGSKELADFVEGLVERVSDISYQLTPADELLPPEPHVFPHDPTKSDINTFTAAARKHVWSYYETFLTQTTVSAYAIHERNQGHYLGTAAAECLVAGKATGDTMVYPLLEMGPFNIHQDSQVTNRLLAGCGEGAQVHLATGYFNLTHKYSDTLVNRTRAHVHLLMSHPTANGFYGSRNPAGGIPHAYTRLAAQFLAKVTAAAQLCRVKMFEYRRDGWTYHAKGLWLTPPHAHLPVLTLIGSPNFGERSMGRDLECQFLITTSNPGLQEALLREQTTLYDRSTPFTEQTLQDPTRRTPLWVRLVVWLLRTYF